MVYGIYEALKQANGVCKALQPY